MCRPQILPYAAQFLFLFHKWVEEQGCPWFEHAFSAAAEHGNIIIMMWLLKKGCPWYARTFTAVVVLATLKTWCGSGNMTVCGMKGHFEKLQSMTTLTILCGSTTKTVHGIQWHFQPLQCLATLTIWGGSSNKDIPGINWHLMKLQSLVVTLPICDGFVNKVDHGIIVHFIKLPRLATLIIWYGLSNTAAYGMKGPLLLLPLMVTYTFSNALHCFFYWR